MRMRWLVLCLTAAAVPVLAGCTASSDGNGSPPTRATVTTAPATTTSAPAIATSAPSTGPSAGATSGVTSAAPPTASGAVVTGAAATSGRGSSTSGSGLCTPTVMTLTTANAEGTAGTSYFDIVATNASQQPCVTTGFPGLAVFDASGRQFLQATRDTSVPQASIVVQPGEKIFSQVAQSDVPIGSEISCPQAAGFLLTLPDNTDSTRFDGAQAVCSVSVQAFQRVSPS